jgi:hypothetical protein
MAASKIAASERLPCSAFFCRGVAQFRIFKHGKGNMRGRIGRKIGLLVLCAGMGACAPPYLELLDKAAGLAGQMTVVGTVGAANVSSGITGVRFFPTMPTASSIGGVDIQSGFVVWDSGSTEYIGFAYSTGNGSATMSSSQPVNSMSLSLADPNYPLFEYDVTNTINNQASVMVLTWNPANPSMSSYQQFTATLPNGGLTPQPSGSLYGTIFTSISLIGGSILPAAPPSYNTFALLGSTAFGTALNGTGGTLAPVGFTSFTFPGTSNRSLYYYSPVNNTSYASYYSSGWQCLQWADVSIPAPSLLPGVTRRVDAVLSTGDLLSTQGGTLSLYDSSGAQLYSIPLNGFQYCYEAYVGSTPYVFFSLAIYLGNNDWAFNVYSIPTSSMRSLH